MSILTPTYTRETIVLLQPANRKTTVSLVYMHVNQVYIRMFYFQAVVLLVQAVVLLIQAVVLLIQAVVLLEAEK